MSLTVTASAGKIPANKMATPSLLKSRTIAAASIGVKPALNHYDFILLVQTSLFLVEIGALDFATACRGRWTTAT